MLIRIMYATCVAISLGTYLWLRVSDVKRSICQNVMVLMILFSNIGFLATSFATSLGEAVLAQKITYVAGCFMPMLYMFTMCELCHFEMKKRIAIPLIVIQCILYGAVCTIGYTDWYYKSIEFTVNEDGIGVLSREYGPLHALYPISLAMYYVGSLVILIFAMARKKAVNRKELALSLVLSAVGAVIYTLERVLHLQVELTAISNIVIMMGTLLPMYHSNLYTVNENQDIVKEQLDRVGFITVNRRMAFMNSNDFAEDLFPELTKCGVGNLIIERSEQLNELLDSVWKYDRQLAVESHSDAEHHHIGLKVLHMNDKHYECEIHTLNNYLKQRVGYVIELRDQTEHYRTMELVNHYNDELNKDVNAKTRKIRTIQEKTILGMAAMVESRDMSTGGHIRRTSDVVRIFAKKLINEDMGFDQHFLDLVIRSAPMHDLGKIGVDDAVLRKNGKFTDEEYEQMKKHSAIGGKMVREILEDVEDEEFVRIAENVAHYHHEKVNGKGYPEGLAGDQIPVEARIMALADVFDALVSKRCYKEAFSYDKAFGIIEADAGSHFDAELAKVFMSCRAELEDYYNHTETNC